MSESGYLIVLILTLALCWGAGFLLHARRDRHLRSGRTGWQFEDFAKSNIAMENEIMVAAWEYFGQYSEQGRPFP